MKMAKNLIAILLGIVIGADVSVLIAGIPSLEPEHLIILFAVMVIVLDFLEEPLARQTSRFSCAIIIGIALRELWQLAMEVCFICTFVTIVGAVAILAAKELLNIRRQHQENQEEIVDDIGVDHGYLKYRGYYDEDESDDEEEEPFEDDDDSDDSEEELKNAEEDTDSKE